MHFWKGYKNQIWNLKKYILIYFILLYLFLYLQIILIANLAEKLKGMFKTVARNQIWSLFPVRTDRTPIQIPCSTTWHNNAPIGTANLARSKLETNNNISHPTDQIRTDGNKNTNFNFSI